MTAEPLSTRENHAAPLLSVEHSIGDRVTHLDLFKQDGSTLPMAGTVVAIEVKYLVQWDDAQPRPLTGWTPTYSYPGDSLAPVEETAA